VAEEEVGRLNFRTTLILLVIFLGLGSYYLFVEREKPTAEEKEKLEKTVFAFDRNEAKSFELSDDEEDIRCIKGEDGWEMVRPVSAKCDDGTVSSVITSLASLQATRFIEADSASLGQFGLDAPAIRASVTVSAPPDSHWLLVGDETPTGDTYYALADSRDRVALIPASKVDNNLKMDAFDFRDKKVLDFEVGQARALELIYDDFKFRCERAPDRPWEIKEPIQTKGDDTEINSILWDLENAKVREFIDEPEQDLSVYGLDPPAAVAKVFIGAGKSLRKIEFGEETEEGGTVFARRTGFDDVVKVDKRLLEKVKTDLIDLRQKRLMDFQTSDVARIEILMGDSTFACVRDSTGEWYTAGEEEKALKKWKMNGVASQISYLRAFSFVDEPRPDFAAMGLLDPQVSVVVTLNDSTTARVDLGRIEGDEVFAKAGDQVARVSKGFLADMKGIVRNPPYTEERETKNEESK